MARLFKKYTDVEVKVRKATNNQPWGVEGWKIAEIAFFTLNSKPELNDVTNTLDERLCSKDKDWRHVLKTLGLIDILLREGSKEAVAWAKNNVETFRSLERFEYIDPKARDVGHHVRVAARNLVAILENEPRLRAERAKKFPRETLFATEGPPKATTTQVAAQERAFSRYLRVRDTILEQEPGNGAGLAPIERSYPELRGPPPEYEIIATRVPGTITPGMIDQEQYGELYDDHDALARAIELSKQLLPPSASTSTSTLRAASSPTAESLPIDNASQKSLVTRLDHYFPESTGSRDIYTDREIYEISMLLKSSNPRWSKAPRTYIVLRLIGNLNLLDDCIDVGFSDYWFPVTERSLPDFLRPSVRAAFVEAQSLILTKSMDLEKGEQGYHCSFRKGETLPFETKGVLGSGGYGQVDKVLSLISFKEYARKRVLRSYAFRGRKTKEVKQFIAEIEILKRLKHRHVVEFVGSYTDMKYIGLVMLPIADMDLTAYMKLASPTNHSELRTFFGCLATALEFLHEHNVRHKDIKPGNTLISNGKVLFADFGLSLDLTDATGSTTMSMVNGMTPRYCAPEVAKQEARNTMADIWSLGVVFLEMIVTLKEQPIQYIDDFFKQRGSQDGFVRLNVDALPELVAHLGGLGHVSDNRVLEWVEQMLLEDQKSRPTASSLVAQITAPSRDGESTGFCGICCISPEEEDFSDYSSE